MTNKDKNGGPVSAKDAMEMLRKNPAYQRKRKEVRKHVQDMEKALSEAERPIVLELRQAGYDVDSVWDFVKVAERYPSAVPIFAKHLPRDYPDAIRDGLARGLATPDAVEHWDLLVRLYKLEKRARASGGLAVAIGALAAGAERIPEVIELIEDERNGDSRCLLLRVLAETRMVAARELLERCAAHPVLGHEARRLMGGRE